MSKFKIGDKVKCIKPFDGMKPELVGKTGKIVEVDVNGDERLIGVDFDNFTGGHNCSGKARAGHGFYGYVHELELISGKKEVIGGKKVSLSEKEFDHLVLPQKDKDEIIATLRQHDNQKKIFEDWGLGEMIEYGRGMTFLFYGGPGTGKTWCANIMAKAIGTELLVVGPAEIQSSEPGGANRAIQAAFKEASSNHKVLFFDECDSLITERGNVGMILGSEINTLLTEIEKFEGVCVLATNRIETLDPALERRISLIVDFPNPDYSARLNIWKKLVPKKMPVDKKASFKKLAEYSLTGGQIKNVILQAARRAASDDKKSVTLDYFEEAISRIQKSGGIMGTASNYRQIMIKDATGSIDTVVGKERDKIMKEMVDKMPDIARDKA